MTGEMGCDQVRDLAPELALGIAEGQERVAALSHLSGCPGCRQLVSDLSSVGDGCCCWRLPGSLPADLSHVSLPGSTTRSTSDGSCR